MITSFQNRATASRLQFLNTDNKPQILPYLIRRSKLSNRSNISMEDSFNVRVDRAFGSLGAASASASIPNTLSKPTSSALWCLTDEEIERQEWIRYKISPYEEDARDGRDLRLKKPKPFSSFLQGILENPQQFTAGSFFKSEASTSYQVSESDIQDLEDGDDSEDDKDHQLVSGQLFKPDDHKNEEWDIRTSVGMDCTLDNEEEEDAYDKVAVGREKSADRLYMRNINDYEVDVEYGNELPSSFEDVIRDPRANHMAAKLRLKEDDESAEKSNVQFSSVSAPTLVGSPNDILEDGVPLNSTGSKKQIGFEHQENGDNMEVVGEIENLMMKESAASDAVAFWRQASSRVPDYVRNPSKYTHYTFDSLGDVDGESNGKAYMDFFNMLKGSNDMVAQDYVSTDGPTSIMFIRKKKSDYGLMSNENAVKKSREDGREEYMHKRVLPVSIAAGDAQNNEVCAMDEDEAELAADRSRSLPKAGRRYRTKGRADVDELII